MDDNNELIIYVLQQLRYGISEQSIRATLAQTGWPQPLIDRAFSMVQQAAPHQVPPAEYPVAQTAYNQPAAELPAPTESPAALPAPEEPQMQFPTAKKTPKQHHRVLRPILITVIIIALLGALGFGIYKVTRHQPAAKSTQMTAAQADAQRKQNIDKLATDLQNYYTQYHSYPTLNDINSLAFPHGKNAFDESKLHDPTWNSKSTCLDGQGRAQLADSRSNDCFSYRVTAMNGSDCDESAKPCTRVVLTANLSNNKPYIVALDQNIKE